MLYIFYNKFNMLDVDYIYIIRFIFIDRGLITVQELNIYKYGMVFAGLRRALNYLLE